MVLAGRLRTAFLDRDGVVNEKLPEGHYVTRWSEFQVLPGVVHAIAALNSAGIRVIVVSNQRGIALGLYTLDDVQAIHDEFQKMLQAFGAHVDGFYFCPHDKEQCTCRKPLPGMFLQVQADFSDINPLTSVMIGDSSSDMEFGKRLGMMTVFIDAAPDRQKPGAEEARSMADMQAKSLPEAVNALLSMRRTLDMQHGTECLGFPAE